MDHVLGATCTSDSVNISRTNAPCIYPLLISVSRLELVSKGEIAKENPPPPPKNKARKYVTTGRAEGIGVPS